MLSVLIAVSACATGCLFAFTWTDMRVLKQKRTREGNE